MTKTIYGFKKLTNENLLMPDPAWNDIVNNISSNGIVHYLTKEDWFHWVYEAKLANTVPEKVQKLFEVARGSLLYGYFFIPCLH